MNEYFNGSRNIKLMKDLDSILDDLQISKDGEYDFWDFYANGEECLRIVNNIKGRNGDNVFDFNSVLEFTKYLKDLHSHLSEDICLDEMEYSISRSEALGDFMYENGYDSYFNGEFQF